MLAYLNKYEIALLLLYSILLFELKYKNKY